MSKSRKPPHRKPQPKPRPSAKVTPEEALITLISAYTRRKDWFMVQRLGNDLARVWEGEF